MRANEFLIETVNESQLINSMANKLADRVVYEIGKHTSEHGIDTFIVHLNRYNWPETDNTYINEIIRTVSIKVFSYDTKTSFKGSYAPLTKNIKLFMFNLKRISKEKGFSLEYMIANTLSHELQHAIDDVKSGGKALTSRALNNNSYAENLAQLQKYLKLPYEVNARFQQAMYDIANYMPKLPNYNMDSLLHLTMVMFNRHQLDKIYEKHQAEYKQLIKRAYKFIEAELVNKNNSVQELSENIISEEEIEVPSEEMLKRYGGKVMPFAKLPEPAKASLKQYMIIDGENEKYDQYNYGYLGLPTEEVIKLVDAQLGADALVTDADKRVYDRYYNGPLTFKPKYPKSSVWPIIWGTYGLEDGGHRLERYIKSGLKVIPIVLCLPECTVLDEVKIDNKNGLGQVPMNDNVDYLGLKVAMRPSTFLNLALPLPETQRQSVAHITQNLEQGGSIGAPFLNIRYPEEWENNDFTTPAKVVGHEGRNRMLAIQKLEGDEPVEVHLFFGGGTRSRHLTQRIRKELVMGLTNQSGTRYITGPLFKILD